MKVILSQHALSQFNANLHANSGGGGQDAHTHTHMVQLNLNHLIIDFGPSAICIRLMQFQLNQLSLLFGNLLHSFFFFALFLAPPL